MLIKLEYLIEKYKLNLKGILHVGAHECEEINTYENIISREKIIWVEAMGKKVEQMKRKYKNIKIEHAVISDKIEQVKFNISNNGQSSSILKLGLHKKFHPSIHYVSSYLTETKLLETIINKNDKLTLNFLNLDIQGAELKALKGISNKQYKNIDYIYTEVNKDYVYENCALINEIDEYLSEKGFKRVETKWWGSCKWGDAFYIKI